MLYIHAQKMKHSTCEHRRNRISVMINHEVVCQTTVGQCNFLYWAYKNGVCMSLLPVSRCNLWNHVTKNSMRTSRRVRPYAGFGLCRRALKRHWVWHEHCLCHTQGRKKGAKSSRDRSSTKRAFKSTTRKMFGLSSWNDSDLQLPLLWQVKMFSSLFPIFLCDFV